MVKLTTKMSPHRVVECNRRQDNNLQLRLAADPAASCLRVLSFKTQGVLKLNFNFSVMGTKL